MAGKLRQQKNEADDYIVCTVRKQGGGGLFLALQPFYLGQDPSLSGGANAQPQSEFFLFS